ncbi:Shedu immune nuclease family protein [Rufibacter sediminis]|uniref:DUF4263 domain-containing protein n=1 Tax=Rufibacter sediminis TaxID=2762756 RepID=A0ABR6VWZ9_9BACT|nr:Shedu immune nuclease family protein [Rufibacter sediminis]MBC3541661.1 DUF4263 domain-containing protein [Rufibacter sediminis]
MEPVKKEVVLKETKTKTVYEYIDTENNIRQISREVYKNKDEVIHYPRGFEGGDKYKKIKKFTFKGFKGKLPVGIFKSASFGWGFTKPLTPFADYIDTKFDLEEVVVEKEGKVLIDVANKKLYISDKTLEKLLESFKTIYQKNKNEVEFVLNSNLYNLFPAQIPKPTKTYIPNALASSLSTWGNSIDEFSDEDKSAIKELFDKLSLTTDFLSKEALAKTKEIVDNKYIQETLKKFKSLMALKTNSENLEKQWQEFLRDNSWIFSSIFAQPVIMYKREAYVGGKTINNQNGKFNDFLIKSSLSDNVSFLEIKTHKTKVLETNPYRGEDVFSASKDLTGCIVQVLNQRDNFQKEFYSIKVKSREKGNFETFNSKCVVLIGSTKDLNEAQKFAFELFRSNSRDVEILTFDELQTKIESLQKVMNQK